MCSAFQCLVSSCLEGLWCEVGNLIERRLQSVGLFLPSVDNVQYRLPVLVMDVRSLDAEGLFARVSREIGEQQATILRENGITGKGLLELKDEEAKELFPTLGDRLSLRAFKTSSKSLTVSWYFSVL